MEDKFFWFPLHSGDFLSKTATLSAGEVGCFILMLVHLTRHKYLPNKICELRRICRGEKAATIKAARRILEQDNLGYYSKEIEAFKGRAAENAHKKSLAGKKGAAARWGNNKQNNMGV